MICVVVVVVLVVVVFVVVVVVVVVGKYMTRCSSRWWLIWYTFYVENNWFIKSNDWFWYTSTTKLNNIFVQI